jgi:hypothetical protein
LELEFLLEKYLPSTDKLGKLSKDAQTATSMAKRSKTKEAHYKAAVAHMRAYDALKHEHLKMQKKDNADIYAYNHTANLAKAHFKHFQAHKKYTDWK